MAITSEIIGKLGGADVKVMPVEGVASGSKGSAETLATIDIPAGETWLVAAIGQVTAGSSVSSRLPALQLGDVRIPNAPPSQPHGLATIASETVSLTIERNYNSGADTFTGHVYTVKL